MPLPTCLYLLITAVALASAAPIYHGISLTLNVSPASSKHPILEPAPVQLNHLTSLHNTKASAITFDQGVKPNGVALSSVECRVFSDAAGLRPLTQAFTSTDGGAKLGEEPVEVGSVLCYVAMRS